MEKVQDRHAACSNGACRRHRFGDGDVQRGERGDAGATALPGWRAVRCATHSFGLRTGKRTNSGHAPSTLSGGSGRPGKNLTFAGEPHHVRGVAVTLSLVHHLGVQPILGQCFRHQSGPVISSSPWRLGVAVRPQAAASDQRIRVHDPSGTSARGRRIGGIDGKLNHVHENFVLRCAPGRPFPHAAD